MIGLFGLLPHWAKDAKLTKSTYNARSETVAVKPAFRDAWHRAQHCVVPAEAIWEPDWRRGRCQWTRIRRPDGNPMGLAGLWSTWHWHTPAGEAVNSFVAGETVRIILQACPGLADQVERAEFSSAATRQLLREYILPGIAEVPKCRRCGHQFVLGCTHYAFLSAEIAAIAGPSVTIVEPSDAIVSSWSACSRCGAAIQSCRHIDKLLYVWLCGPPGLVSRRNQRKRPAVAS